MSGSHSEISEWWDHHGHYHEGAPTPAELLHNAEQVTGHIRNDNGDSLYFTSISEDGWTEEEWADDVDDAENHYLGGN